jgi:hypothetical protein
MKITVKTKPEVLTSGQVEIKKVPEVKEYYFPDGELMFREIRRLDTITFEYNPRYLKMITEIDFLDGVKIKERGYEKALH